MAGGMAVGMAERCDGWKRGRCPSAPMRHRHPGIVRVSAVCMAVVGVGRVVATAFLAKGA